MFLILKISFKLCHFRYYEIRKNLKQKFNNKQNRDLLLQKDNNESFLINTSLKYVVKGTQEIKRLQAQYGIETRTTTYIRKAYETIGQNLPMDERHKLAKVMCHSMATADRNYVHQNTDSAAARHKVADTVLSRKYIILSNKKYKKSHLYN